MRNVLLTLGIIGLLVVLLGGRQDDPVASELAQMRHAIADLGLRVSRLEQAAGAGHGETAPDGTAAAAVVVRSMVVGGIQTADDPPANQGEIDALQGDVDALQKTVNHHKDESDRVAGNTYYEHGYYGDSHYGYDHSHSGRNRQERAQRKMADRYSTQLGIKQRKLDDLKHASMQSQQVIHGHDGDVFFTLRTKVDLSRPLKEIGIGDTVTWRGERVSADASGETWLISSIEKIERP